MNSSQSIIFPPLPACFRLLLPLIMAVYFPIFGQNVSAITVVLPSEKSAQIALRTVNNRGYASLAQLSRAAFPGSVCAPSRNEISFKTERLRFAPSSFMVLRENSTGSRVAQMNVPAITLDGELYVPATQFFPTLETLGLYKVTMAPGRVVLRMFGQAPPSAELLAPPIDSSIPKPKAKPILSEKSSAAPSSEIDTPGDEHLSAEPPVIVPGRYTLPPDLVRSAEPQAAKITLPKSSETQKINVAVAAEPKALPKSVQKPKPSAPKQERHAEAPAAQHPENTVSHTPENTTVEAEKPSTKATNHPSDNHKADNHKADNHKADNHKAEEKPRAILAEAAPVNVPAPSPGKPSAEVPETTSDASSSLESAEVLEMESTAADIRVTSVAASRKSSEKTEILFRSNVPIPTFQKPEIHGKEITIRFPQVANSVSSFDEIERIFPLSEVRAETVKGVLNLHLALKIEPKSCEARRVGERGIALSIEYPPSEMGDKATTETTKKRWDLDVIVLDAGHGGEDAGAVSINGFKEKDVTLAIAKKIKKLLKELLPKTKVVMTRQDDTFIELYRRSQIANQAGGKLFLSIHCNSMPSKPHPANGFESYILRPGRNDDAVRVADRENGVIKLEKRKDKYQELSEEKLIVATMAQSAFVKFSELFASNIQEEVGKTTALHNRGVNQAGFYVLVGSSMPNVLFETAFLSNTDDEKFITSDKGQEKIAEGIAKAIKRYASEYSALIQKSK